MEIYLVGGAVRDKLLGREVADRDWVVVNGSHDEMVSSGYKPVGVDFTVYHHPKTNEEYSLARQSRLVSQSSEAVSLYDDLSRRDLTINAMAETLDGQLIDHFNGKRDLESRLLRHVSDAFSEDPIRVLRVARFAARYHKLGFRVADETMSLMSKVASDGLLDKLVPDRVWKEVVRAIAESHPEVFIQVLRDCGALSRIMPELDALFGVPQPVHHHPEVDTGVHVLMVLQQAAKQTDSVDVRIAALFHDLGKGVTPKEKLPSHHGHEDNGLPLIKSICARIGAPNSVRDLALITSKYHTHCHRAFDLTPPKMIDVFYRMDAFRRPDRFNDFLICCEADAKGRLGFEDREYPQSAFLKSSFDAAKLANSKDIDPLKYPGVQFAQQLRHKRLVSIKLFLKAEKEIKQDEPTLGFS